MKYIFLFLFSLAFGIALILLYGKWMSRQDNPQLLVPTSGKKFTAFSLENAPSMTIKGKIASLSGDVEWESRVATTPAKLTKPISVQQGELLRTNDNGNILIQFSDIFSISMFPLSELNIIQTLPTNFVFLQNKGTAEYIKTGSAPLGIRCLHLLISQNTGDIIVTADKIRPIITVIVKNGSAVIGFNDLQSNTNIETILGGQTFIFNDEKRIKTL